MDSLLSGDIPLTLAVSLDFLSAWGFWISVGVIAGTYGIFTLGLQLNVGESGVVNFGQVGFMAIGAYSMVVLSTTAGMSLLLVLPASLALTMLAGVLVGIPALRLRADYLAITTIAFAELVRYIAQNARGLTGGFEGTIALELKSQRTYSEAWQSLSDWIADTLLVPLGLSGTDFFLLPLLLVTWIVLALLAVVIATLEHSPWGRVMRAIREDEDAARAVGKNAFAFKLQSLAIGAGLGCVAGWFLAWNLVSFSYTAFLPEVTFFGIAILMLGGMTSVGGVLVASALFWTVFEGLRFLDFGLASDSLAALRYVLVGLLLIVLMALRPQGLFGRREEMVLSD